MFEIGDYVLNATNGICKISEIVELDMSGDKKLKSYFLLRPVEEQLSFVFSLRRFLFNGKKIVCRLALHHGTWACDT